VEKPNRPAVAVITGGEGDLARALAECLAAAGYRVEAPGRDRLDVSDPDSVAAFFSGLEKVDLLVNNAGITRDASVGRMSESDWDEVLSVNLRGAFLCARAAIKTMFRRRCGHIVNIGSYSAVRPPAGQIGYASSKAGLVGLTQALAEEVGKRAVRVNCVLPGFLETRMTDRLKPERVEAVREDHVLGKFNTPGDAARFIVFLDSMENVSGQVFQLDSRLRRWC